ncbi:MAG: hypothetical protein ACTSYT_01120 [Candidatus Asgardarchaeia archaeon]
MVVDGNDIVRKRILKRMIDMRSEYGISSIDPDSISNYLKVDRKITVEFLRELVRRGFLRSEGGFFIFSKERIVNFAHYCIENGISVENASKLLSGHEFEEFVSSIFSYHNYSSLLNFVFKCEGIKREIDILAHRGHLLFGVDTKRWRKGLGYLGRLKDVVESQVERISLLGRCFDKVRRRFSFEGVDFIFLIPLIVTLYGTAFRSIDGVFVVPSDKLNNFLLNFDESRVEDSWHLRVDLKRW